MELGRCQAKCGLWADFAGPHVSSSHVCRFWKETLATSERSPHDFGRFRANVWPPPSRLRSKLGRDPSDLVDSGPGLVMSEPILQAWGLHQAILYMCTSPVRNGHANLLEGVDTVSRRWRNLRGGTLPFEAAFGHSIKNAFGFDRTWAGIDQVSTGSRGGARGQSQSKSAPELGRCWPNSAQHWSKSV